MAIIEDLGLAVSVVINGKAVPDYDDPVPATVTDQNNRATKVVNKYIESEDEIEYSIRLEVLPSHRYLPNREGDMLAFYIKIDGISIDTFCFTYRQWQEGKGADWTQAGVQTSANTLRRFKFSAANLRDGADPKTINEDKDRSKELGTIYIEVFRAILLRDAPTRDACETTRTADLNLAEKAVKGRHLPHGTSLSPATRLAKASAITFAYFHKIDNVPYAVFSFKYRSRDELRDLKIIPPANSAGRTHQSVQPSDEEDRETASPRPAVIKKKGSSSKTKSRRSRLQRTLAEINGLTSGRIRKKSRRN